METLTRIAEALLQPEVDQLFGVVRSDEHEESNRGHPSNYYPAAVWNGNRNNTTLEDDSFSNHNSNNKDTTATTHWNDAAIDDKATVATEEESESESEEEEVLVAPTTNDNDNDDEASLTEDEEMTDDDDDDSMVEDKDGVTTKNKGNNDKYWLDPTWIPTDRAGRQIQPTQIRQQLVRFLQQTDMTKTAFLKKLGVNANSFNKFVSPNQYVGNYNERSKLNATYMNGARFVRFVCLCCVLRH